MIVHRRWTGSLVPNILGRGTMNEFCSDMDWVPVRLY